MHLEFVCRLCLATGWVVTPTVVADPLLLKSVTIAGTRFPVKLATQAGHPYDARAVASDVRKLWATGRFDEIQVESDGTAIVFRVREALRLRLREIHIAPSSFGFHPKIPAGTLIDSFRAHEIALEAQKRLKAEGYLHARVDTALLPVAADQVDLRLIIHAGEAVDLKSVEFQGDTGLRLRELRGALRAARIRRVLPPVPGIWAGWRLFPAYDEPALEGDLARLRSLYLSRGYFDANVRLGDVEIEGKSAKAEILVQSGSKTPNSGTADLCSCLLAARRDAERRGLLEFSATADLHPLAAHIEEGPAYRVGRIEFTGNHRFSDSAVRRNLVIEEGAPLDHMLLRRSIARINRTGWFEPIGESEVAIQADPATGVAHVTLGLTERRRRAWSISGPVGPFSIAGPLQASLSSRVPLLPTYAVSLSLVAFAHPLLPLPAFAAKNLVWPALALQRPFTPGEGWMSGFAVSPQLGWQRTVLGYAATQIQRPLLPLALEEELPVTVQSAQGEITLFCEPPKPRLAKLRRGAAIGLRLLSAS